MISYWEDLTWTRREKGHLAADWQSLTGERSHWLGAQRIRVDAGKWATPLHLEASEEETFYVLSGSGISVQSDNGGEEQAFAVGPGDCLVHLALDHAHTLGAGPDGIEILAFGERHYAANTFLPRAGVSWLGPTWVRQGAPGDHPWEREAAVGPPIVGELSERPARIVNVEDVQATARKGKTVARRVRDLGRAAGSLHTGLTLYDVAPGMLMSPPHCHSEEEEIFVVLSGAGTVELWPNPRAATQPEQFADTTETCALRPGATFARPAGTGRAHAVTAGSAGLRVLAFGMRRPNDITYYPRSGKISFRGVGVIGRVEQVPYWDGED